MIRLFISYLTDGSILFTASNRMDFCYTAPSYQVEARARIIFFEIGRADTEANLQRSMSQTVEVPRMLSKEHSGLLSWPESFRKSIGPQHASLTDIRNHPGSLSARALQLSMYGSMVCVCVFFLSIMLPGSIACTETIRLFHCSSFHPQINVMDAGQKFRRGGLQASQKNQKQSSSYPRVPSRSSNARPLLSVQSEGSNLMSRKAPALAPAPAPAAGASRQRQRKAIEDDKSSDESAGEEEVIVRVDSPSMLSFTQAPHGN